MRFRNVKSFHSLQFCTLNSVLKLSSAKPEIMVSLFRLRSSRQHRDSPSPAAPLLTLGTFNPHSHSGAGCSRFLKLITTTHSCPDVPFPSTAVPSLIVGFAVSELWLLHQIASGCRTSVVSFSVTQLSTSATHLCEIWLEFLPFLFITGLSLLSCLCFAVCLSLSSLPQHLPVLLWWRNAFSVPSKLRLNSAFFPAFSKLFSHPPCKMLEMWSSKRNCSWVMELIRPGFLPESSISWMPPLSAQTELPPSSLPVLSPLPCHFTSP